MRSSWISVHAATDAAKEWPPTASVSAETRLPFSSKKITEGLTGSTTPGSAVSAKPVCKPKRSCFSFRPILFRYLAIKF